MLLTAAAVGDEVISVPLDAIILIVLTYSRVIPTTLLRYRTKRSGHQDTTDEKIMNIFGRSPGSQQSRGSDTESVSDTEQPIVNRGIDRNLTQGT